MCLYVKNKEPKIAKCNISCYKMVLRQQYPSCNEYFSPYMYMPISKECINGDKNMEPNEIMIPKNVCIDETNFIFGHEFTAYIEGGMIHTYMRKEDAIKDATAQGTAPLESFEVYECMIPIGTEYYEGTDSEFCCYASKAIKFIKKIY